MAIKIKAKVPKAPMSEMPMPASKHFDIILGLDFHIILISGFPIPMPIIPFGALTFDPMDYIHITIPCMPVYSKGSISLQSAPMGGTVTINGFYRGGATSSLMGMPPLVPPLPAKFGGAMAKKLSLLHLAIPKPLFVLSPLAPHDGQLSHGSKTVITQGLEQSTHMDKAYSCNEMGKILMNNPMGLYHNYATLILVVLPLGKPVFVGGSRVEHAMGFDDLVNSLMMMGIMKGAGKLLKKILGKLATKLNQALCKKFPKFAKFGEGLQPHICKHLGEPVDAASGVMTGLIQGFNLPGPIPLNWEAQYYSNSNYEGPLGMGMVHSYDISMVVMEEDDTVLVNDAHGRGIAFPTLLPGTSFFHPGEKLVLHRDLETEEYCFSNKQGLFHYFEKHARTDGTRSLRSIANRNGFSIQFRYDGQGYLHQIIDSAHRLIQVYNDNHGRILGLAMPHPKKEGETFMAMQYGYNAQGQLIAFTDALGHTQQLEWNRERIIARKFKDGTKFTFTYDAKGRCTAAEGPQGLYSYFFKYEQNKTLVTNAVGAISTYHHRGGIVTKIVNPLGGEKIFTYDVASNLIAEQNEAGIVHNYSYDDKGNLTQIGLPGGGIVDITYNEFHQPTKTILPNQAVWKYAYDAEGNLIESENPLGQKIGYNYREGLLRGISNTVGVSTEFSYDHAYNLHKVFLPGTLGNITYSYDGLGNCLSIEDPRGNLQSRNFDQLGRITEIMEPDGNWRRFHYNVNNNVIQANDKHNEIQLEYNFFGSVTKRRQGGTEIRFVYDKEGQLQAIWNEHNEVYQFKHDANGQVKTEIGFDGLTRNYFRNLAGQVMELERPNGLITSYQYSSGGLLTHVRQNDGLTESYGYDALGGLIQAINGTSEIQLKRDLLGRVVAETQGDHEVKSNYNELGLRSLVTSSLGAHISLQHDRITGLAENMKAGTYESQMQYDRFGRLTQRQYTGQLQQDFEYDRLGRLSSQSLHQGSTQRNIHRRQYVWDVDYRLKSVTDSAQGQKTFNHDVHGNLSEVIYGNGQVEYRMPDAMGNLFESRDRSDRKYDKGGKLLKSRHGAYKYDTEGNLLEKKTSEGTWQYHWLSNGMLDKVTRPDREAVSFGYDALGRRVWKRYRNTITRWVWDGNTPLHEWKENAITGTVLHSNPEQQDGLTTWIFDEYSFVPAGKLKGDKSYSILTDHLGTPFQMYTEQGNKFWECELSGKGAVKMQTGEVGSCPFRYQGQYEDVETGLYYNRFRYYSPEEGMYVSQDPIGVIGGFKLYSYVQDPSSWLDQFGLNSTVLNKNLGGVVGDKMQAHHVIPEQVWDNPQNKAMFDHLGMQKDAAQNGILLPDNEALRQQLGTGVYHSGSHPQFNAQVQADVDAIRNQHVPGVNDASIRTKLEDLQKKLQKDCASGNVPHSPHATGCKIG